MQNLLVNLKITTGLPPPPPNVPRVDEDSIAMLEHEIFLYVIYDECPVQIPPQAREILYLWEIVWNREDDDTMNAQRIYTFTFTFGDFRKNTFTDFLFLSTFLHRSEEKYAFKLFFWQKRWKLLSFLHYLF